MIFTASKNFYRAAFNAFMEIPSTNVVELGTSRPRLPEREITRLNPRNHEVHIPGLKAISKSEYFVRSYTKGGQKPSERKFAQTQEPAKACSK